MFDQVIETKKTLEIKKQTQEHLKYKLASLEQKYVEQEKYYSNIISTGFKKSQMSRKEHKKLFYKIIRQYKLNGIKQNQVCFKNKYIML